MFGLRKKPVVVLTPPVIAVFHSAVVPLTYLSLTLADPSRTVPAELTEVNWILLS